MSEFTLILFLIGCAGTIVSSILLIIAAINKKNQKKRLKLLGIFFALVVVSIALKPKGETSNISRNDNQAKQQSNSSVPKNTLTQSDKELLKKSYFDFDSKQRTQFAEIESKYSKLDEAERASVKDDFDRMSKEKVEQNAKFEEEKKQAEAKVWDDFVAKNSKDLSAGEHTVGQQLEKGLYDITLNGMGNLIITTSKGALLINEMSGEDLGISKCRVPLSDGDKIELKGLTAKTAPVKPSLRSYEEVNLYSGYWSVGTDITKGRYVVKAQNGNGNFIINSKNGSLKTNEVIGGSYGVKEVVVNLEDGDLINIRSLNSVIFTPSK